MLFKVINKDKVKILVEKDELPIIEELDYYDPDKGVPRSVAELLIKTYEQTGIDFLNSKIMLEVVHGVSQSYYIIITRLSISANETEDYEVDMYIFKLSGAEAVFDIAEAVECFGFSERQRSDIYKYRGLFYLCMYFTADSVKSKDFNALISAIEEKAERCSWNIVNDAILREWGEPMAENVINKITADTE